MNIRAPLSRTLLTMIRCSITRAFPLEIHSQTTRALPRLLNMSFF